MVGLTIKNIDNHRKNYQKYVNLIFITNFLQIVWMPLLVEQAAYTDQGLGKSFREGMRDE
jgi:hypothetical protein